MIGTTLDGRYLILGQLGEGGMGEVYLAEHVLLGRKEALKILHPALADDPEFVSRFRREARAANRLQHPNIVTVHDFGRLPDGRFYLCMEYAEGERLDAVVRKLGNVPVSRALALLAQIADATHHAHSRGVVHRDLKPENIVLVAAKSQPEMLKILDFGIAKIVAPDHNESMILSTQGHVYGTPTYMSPEQFDGVGTDLRSDIYSIGCIGFELLVGDPPFLAKSLVQMIHAHKTKVPDRPSKRRPRGAIPAEFDAVILRCLEKAPQNRFQTGAQLLEAIRSVPGYRSEKTPSNRRSSHRILPRPESVVAPAPRRVRECDADSEPEGEDGTDAGTDTGDGSRTTSVLTTDTVWEGIEDLELASTLLPDVPEGADPVTEARGILLEIALRLSDLVRNDLQLVVGVTSLTELNAELGSHESEMGTLDARLADLDQAVREREASLRFALSELRFARAEALSAGQPVTVDLEHQIRALDKRLAAVRTEYDREQTVITDRMIALTAALDNTRERLAPVYDTLERLVEELLRRFAQHATIAPLVGPLRRARARRIK